MTKPRQTYTFDTDLDSDYDGDTMHVTLHWEAPPAFGFSIIAHRKLRLKGINCPELKNPDGSPNPAGLAARDYAKHWNLSHAAPYRTIVEGDGMDKYSNRIDGRLIAADGACLNDDLLSSGNAVVMKG